MVQAGKLSARWRYTTPLSVGSLFSRMPLLRAPKKRTVRNARGEAAM